MSNAVGLQSLTSIGTAGGTHGASLTKPGDYPFQLSRQNAGDLAYHYYAVLKVGADGAVALQLSRSQSPEDAKANFELPELVLGVARANVSGPSFGFHSPNQAVLLSAVETQKGIRFIGRIDGWSVGADPAAFTRLQPPARRPSRPDRNPDGWRSSGGNGIQRDVCGRLVTAPFDFYVRPSGTRT